MTASMEDNGSLLSLSRLADDARVDMDPVLVLRTTSNDTMSPDNQIFRGAMNNPTQTVAGHLSNWYFGR
jgi:purine nucleoside permease